MIWTKVRRAPLTPGRDIRELWVTGRRRELHPVQNVVVSKMAYFFISSPSLHSFIPTKHLQPIPSGRIELLYHRRILLRDQIAVPVTEIGRHLQGSGPVPDAVETTGRSRFNDALRPDAPWLSG